MAANLEENVVQLRKEVETLRETERQLKSREICCQKAKERFLLKHTTSNYTPKGKAKSIVPQECREDRQFSEILSLLSEIKKQKGRLLMLKHQLHCEQMKQEVGVLNAILQRQSEILVGLRAKETHPAVEVSPLAFWYAEMVHAVNELPRDSCKGKLSEMNRLFYNVYYNNNGKEPCDLLEQVIRKKKIKCDQAAKDVAEKLQFSTCYKGFCIQIEISKIVNDTGRNEDRSTCVLKTDSEPSLYQCYSDIDLNDLQKHLLEQLLARRKPETSHLGGTSYCRHQTFECLGDMALKLSQVLDLAISTDIASVNFLHLRDVLVTVVASLDIGSVTVKKTTHCAADGDAEGSDLPLSDVEEQENGSVTHNGDDEGENLSRSIDKDENDNELTVGEENEDKGRKLKNDDSQQVERSGSVKENGDQNARQSGRIKSVKDAGKRGRSESTLSKVSNVIVPHNSALSNKVSALEEGLKSLRNIVGDLISRGDFGGNLSNSLMEKLEEAEKDMEKATEHSVEGNESPTKELDSGRSNTGRISKIERSQSRQHKREVSGKSTSQRPVTQPVPGKDRAKGQPPVLTRAKTEDLSLVGRKPMSRKVSVLEKLKQRRRNSSINEEVSGVDGETKESVGNTKDSHGEKGNEVDTMVGLEDKSKPSRQDSSDTSEDEVDSEEDLEEMIENEIEAALNDPTDPGGPVYAVRLGLEQMQSWRETFLEAQDEFRLEVGECRNSVKKMQNDIQAFRLAKKTQDAERFNAVHHVHGLVLELDTKHTKLSKSVNELVDELNRQEKTFNTMFKTLEKLDEQKVDKILLSSQVGAKANKDDLRDKVSMSTFDESFLLLDRGLSDALDKMANHMSMEEALRETLNEMQSGMELKLNRDEMESLKDELEARIKEVRSVQEKVLEGKPDVQGDPAGFKRKTEKVRCISCDRDLEIETSQVQVLPSIPKAQRLPGTQLNKSQPSREGNVTKKAADDEYRLSRIKTEMVQGTGLLDFTTFPMSQRFCGGRHTIMRANKRSLASSHFNDYVMIRNESSSLVELPTREFIVSRDSDINRFMKQKLPGINELQRLPGIREGVVSLNSVNGNVAFLSEDEEKTKPVEKKSNMSSTVVSKIPICKNDDE